MEQEISIIAGKTPEEKEPTLTEDFRFKFLFWAGISATAFMLIIMTMLFIERPQPESNSTGIAWVQMLTTYLTPVFNVAAGSIAMIGIVSLVFRSEQTARQLEHSNRALNHERRKSSFSIFIEHQELFNKTIDIIEEHVPFRFEFRGTLYKHMFPFNEIKNFDISIPEESLIGNAIKIAAEIIETDHAHKKQEYFSQEELEVQYERFSDLCFQLWITHNKQGKDFMLCSDLKSIHMDLEYIISELTRISSNENYKRSSGLKMGAIYYLAIRQALATRTIDIPSEEGEVFFVFGSLINVAPSHKNHSPNLVRKIYIPIDYLPVDKEKLKKYIPVQA
ncbi:hypothetical protein ACJJIC_14680 [Microbulbifer sp. ANSA002]|uniref:hypothetical protein n=1 Tax=unclassified Microbulbifer TaxID=2619833 RepID=UPI00404197B5